MFWSIIKYLPYVVPLVQAVEKCFGPGSGKQKKALVLSTVELGIDLITEESTGGQRKTWERIGPYMGKLIDNLVSILFPH